MDVTRDLDNLQFNTAIARMMEFVNFFTKQSDASAAAMEQFVLLLSPFAPHIAEELWQALGAHAVAGLRAVAGVRRSADAENTIEVPVQVGKKVRAKIKVPAEATTEQLEAGGRERTRRSLRCWKARRSSR